MDFKILKHIPGFPIKRKPLPDPVELLTGANRFDASNFSKRSRKTLIFGGNKKSGKGLTLKDS